MTERTTAKIDDLSDELRFIKACAYDKCGFALTDFKRNPESKEYGACSFVLNGKSVQYRVSKITPTKVGQFVTIWKRNTDGVTEPFNVADEIDFLIITTKKGDNFGQFIFPKSVLSSKAVFTENGRGGKRGMRVYPPWDKPESRQAEKTQEWQKNFFVSMKHELTDLNAFRQLLK